MAATEIDVQQFINDGKERGATHVMIVTDTANDEVYPVYVMPGENVDRERRRCNRNMQRVNEVIPLDQPSENPDSQ